MIGVRVPGSTSNLGAGFDCLGLALDMTIEARVVEGAGPPAYSGTLTDIDHRTDFVADLTAGLVPDDSHLEISSTIPVARGLGSSAAATVAGLALRDLLRTGAPDRDALFAEAAMREGHPDNAGPSVFGGLVLAAHRPEPLAVHSSLGVALAIPVLTVATKTARGLLPTSVPRHTAVAQAARAASLVHGLVTGNERLVRFGMEDQIAVPKRIDLIPGFAAATEAGERQGAYGVTISGSGPTVLAITSAHAAESVAAAMAEALSRAGNQAAPACPAINKTGLVVLGS